MYSEASYDYPNEFAFTSLKALKEYFHLTASELAIWREEGECPDREELDRIRDCEIVSSVEKKTTKDRTELKEIYSFRVSPDGDHWGEHCVGGYFSSLDKLIQYVEALLIDEGFMSDEDIKIACRNLKKDLYTKWVNPEDKKDKYYIKVDKTGLDNQYSE